MTSGRSRTSTEEQARESKPELVELASKLKWLMFFRMAMISVLLGATMIFNADEISNLDDPLQTFFMRLIVVVYLASLVYSFVLPRTRHLKPFAHLQLSGDVLLSLALVWGTGGTSSVFTFIFSLTIINGAIILYRSGALITATTSSIAFLVLVFLENSDWMGRAQSLSGFEQGGDRNLYFITYIHLATFYLIGVMASYLAQMLRRADHRIRVQARDIERFRALNEKIVSSIPSGLATISGGKITFFNRSAERITGLKAKDVLEKPLETILPGVPIGRSPTSTEPETRREPTPEPVRTRTEEPTESSFKRPDGVTIRIGYKIGRLRPAVGESDGGLLVLFEDVTQLRSMEETVRRSQRLASIGQLAAGLAHEVRNPLAAISGAVQLLSCGEHVSDEERTLLEIVQREADRLERLIATFLGYARPSSRGRRPVGVRELIRMTLKMFENDPVLQEGIRCEVVASQELWVEGDADQLKQILWNLLTNAAQAMNGRQGFIRVEATRRPSADERNASWVEVAVEDQGEGMSEELLARIFDPFFTTRPSGTGLGLATVHRIVEEHHGLLEVRSKPGEGTRIAFLLEEVRMPS